MRVVPQRRRRSTRRRFLDNVRSARACSGVNAVPIPATTLLKPYFAREMTSIYPSTTTTRLTAIFCFSFLTKLPAYKTLPFFKDFCIAIIDVFPARIFFGDGSSAESNDSATHIENRHDHSALQRVENVFKFSLCQATPQSIISCSEKPCSFK